MDNQNLQKQIDDLKAELANLKSYTTLPLDNVEAMRKRLTPVSGEANGTATTAYIQAVDEGGSASYDVAKPMTGFITITIDGNARLVPYY